MRKVDRLLNFQPLSMTYIEPSNKWIIKGKARFSHLGQEYSADCSMRAFQVNGEWLFDNLAIDVAGGK